MKLTIRNIGKIAEADIEINTITVVAGENDTGKSTLSKTLFALLYSLYDSKNYVFHEKNEYLFNLLSGYPKNQQFVDEELIGKIIKLYRLNKDLIILRDKITHLLESNGYINTVTYREQFDDLIDFIIGALSLSDIDIIKKKIEEEFKSEFNNQITNLYANKNASLCCIDGEQSVDLVFDHKQNVDFTGEFNSKLSPIYIDNSNILESGKISRFNFNSKNKNDNHEDALLKRLFFRAPQNAVHNLLNEKKTEEMLQNITSIIGGKLFLNKDNECYYQENENSPSVSVNNLSAGIKIFAILKSLLQNNQIMSNTILILDEPETHLHPRLQVVLAELIVLFQKTIGLKILLNTHSPYFLEAIEVYSAKYSLFPTVKFYLSHNYGNASFIKDTTSNIDAIYSLLAAPIYKLEGESIYDN